MKKTLITAGIHGSEIGAVLIAHEIKGWVESLSIKDVEVLPKVNLEAIEHKQRENPQDGKDLNRLFPGKEDGTRSKRIAHRLFQKAKDYERIIDLHTYGKNRWCIPYMLTDLDKDYNEKFCEEIGLKTAVQTGGTDSQLFLETSNLGIPSMIIEAGGAERYRDELEEVKKAILGYIIDDYDKHQNRKTNYYEYYERIKPELEGYYEPKVEPGKKVDKGDSIGTIGDTEIKAEFSGLVLGTKLSGEYDPEESIAAIAKL